MKRFYALSKACSINRTVGRTCLFAFFLLMSSLVFINKTYATHAAGSDISYKWISGNTYQVTVTFYRSCSGIAAPNNVTLDITSASLGDNLTQTLNKLPGTGQEISHACTGEQTNCTNSSSSLEGIQQYVYEGNVTLPGPAADWVFSYSICCRNCSISTIVHPTPCNQTNTTPELYVQATLNSLVAPTNSSPTFSVVPVGFICEGQTFTFNQGALDASGDSLTYQLITPKTGPTTGDTVTFLGGFSKTNFISSSPNATLNTATGQLTMNPTDTGQVGILAIQVNQYHNGVLVGSTIRDMQFKVIKCTNHLASATGINGTGNFSLTVCPGTHVNFTINSSDNTPGLKVTMSWNSGISGATFDTATAHGNSYPTGTFNWPSAVKRPQPYTFVVTVEDNGCSYNSIQSYVFTVNVTDIQSAITPSNFNGFNISCNGASNGTATVNQFGGTAPYTWSWKEVGVPGFSASTQTITGLGPGTYTVTITDANGCTGDTSATIIQPNAVSANIKVVSDASCNGIADGKDSVSASGGVTPYTYLWSPGGATTQVLSNVVAGIYTVTVEDANSCSVVKTDTIKQPDNPIVITIDTTSNEVHCNGEASGAINISVTGGTLPYSYLWSTTATTEDISGLSAGIYTVTVKDINQCSAVKVDTVTQPDTILALVSSPVISGVNITCHGSSTGTAQVTVSGGTPPYTYSWSNGATGSNISGLAAGQICVTVFDKNGCSNTTCDTLTQPTDSFFIQVDSVHNVTCNGLSNGAIFTSVHGGTPGYTFAWTPSGPTTENDSNLIAGVYSVTVTDNLGCMESATQSVSQPNPLTVVAIPTDTSGFNIKCHGENTGGFITVVAGGTGPYTYLWSNGATTDSITGLFAGTPATHYDVTVFDANGCSVVSNSTDTLTQPDTILPLITGAVVTGGQNLLCHGDHNATAFVAVVGGKSPYNFTWSNGQTTTGTLADTVIGLGAGPISVSVTDQNGCFAFATFTITQPDSIAITFNNTNLTCNASNDGSINLGITGGTGAYTITWFGGATTDTISSLTPGTYIVTVTDANGCSTIDSTTITQPDSLAINASPTPVLCNGAGNGFISYNITGGTLPYTIVANGFTSSNPDSVLGNLTPGNYTINVRDANGCATSVTDSISQPNVLTDSLIATSPACFGNVFDDSIIQVTAGGSMPYFYSWSNGATSQNLVGILPGITYTSTVTDANGCSVIDSATLINPTPITDTVIGTNLSCFGAKTGILTVTNVIGGTGPYTYFWTNESTTDSSVDLVAGQEYHVTITDQNGCAKIDSGMLTQPDSITISPAIVQPTCADTLGSISISVSGGTGATYTYTWSNTATTQNVDSLTAGTYTVTVTDSLSCSKTASFTLNKGTITLDTVVTQPNCTSLIFGSIQLTTSGGTAPFTYNWTGPNGYTSSAQNIDSLKGGSYSLTVTDSTGCTNTATFSIASCCHLVISGVTVTTPSACDTSSGSIIISQITGGTTGTYTYLWSNSTSSTNILPDSLNNLTAATYTVTVVDPGGCSADTSITIVQDQPITVSGVQVINSDVCESFVGIVFNITGGIPPYTISATDTFGTIYTTSNDTLANLSSGIYCVSSITDSKGCTAKTLPSCDTIQATPSPFNVSIASSFNSPCDPLTNDSITLNVTGAIPPYTFQWSNSATTRNLSSVAPGIQYKVTITDSHGCSTEDSIIPPPSAPLSLVQAMGVYARCPSATIPDSINVSWLNGIAPYTIILEGQIFGSLDTITGITSTDVTVPVPIDDIYNVVVSDVGGCQDSTTFVFVFGNGPLTAVSFLNDQVTCANGHDGSFLYQVTGGNPTYQISIVGPDSTITTTSAGGEIANAGVGTYIINVVDSLGCTTSDTIVLTSLFTLTDSIVVKPISCTTNPTDTVNVIVTNGTGPYTYLWSNNATTDTVTGLTYGTYKVTLTDLTTGCDTVKSFTIDSSSALGATPGIVSNPTCGGNCNGIASANASGGAGGYTYSWSNSVTASTDSSLCADSTYKVTVTDLSGCSIVRSVTTGGSLPLTISISGTPIACGASSSNDTLSVTVNGGAGPFTYAWSNGATGSPIIVDSSKTYCVTVTDFGGCTGSACDTVNVTPTPPVLSFSVTNVTGCNGDSTGAIGLTVTGSGTFTYSWSNSATTQNISGLKANTYCVTVTSGTGCSADSCITITQPSAITDNLTFTYDSTCSATSPVNIQAVASGGTPGIITPYTYAWSSDPAGFTNSNSQIFSVAAGITYIVTITDSVGCTKVDSITPVPNTPLSLLQSNATDALCSYSNGTIVVTYQGGTAPYNISWSDGTTTSSVSTSATSDTLSVAPNAFYNVTVTDRNGCSLADSLLLVNSPPPITDSIVATTGALCFGATGDTITSIVNGGTVAVAYGYSWSNTATTVNLDGVGGGTYTLTVTDDNGCTAVSNTIVIKQNTQIQPNLTVVYDSLCSATSPANVVASPSGGTPGVISGYTYLWSPGGATTDSLTSVATGITYTVTVTDSLGCTAVDSINPSPNPALALLTTNPTDALCSYSDGTIQISYLNGTAPYKITWSDGTTTDSVTTSATSDTINVAPDAFYGVTVTDKNGCSLSNDFILINAPSPISDSIVATTGALCFGSNNDTINSIVSGGTVAVAYGYSWSNTATTVNLDGVGGGTYTLTVTDDNGCTAVSNTIVIKANTQIHPNLTFTYDSLCSATSPVNVVASPSGGTPGVISGYTYLWSPGGATTDSLTSVATGITYTVTVTDSLGCTAIDSINPSPNPALALLTTNPTDALCSYSDGTIQISYLNGTAPYKITWSDGTTTDSLTTSATSDTINVAPNAFYGVTVTDKNGCSLSNDFILVNAPAPISDSIVATTAGLCFGSSNDTINSIVSGGTVAVAYGYSWSNTATTVNLDGVGGGTYTLTVTDDNGCTAVSNTIVIKQNTQIHPNLTSSYDSLCSATSPANVVANPSGGTPGVISGYTYLWSPGGATTDSLTSVATGITYVVTVTDSLGCTAVDSIQPAPNPALSLLTANPTDALCSYSNGTIEISYLNGSGPYKITWSDGNTTDSVTTSATSDTITVAPNAFYGVTVTDKNGCSIADNFILVNAPSPITVDTFNVIQPTCANSHDGSISFTVSGGTSASGDYTITITGPGVNIATSTTSDTTISGLGAGTYHFNITDDNGCTADSIVILNSQHSLSVTIDKIQQVLCNSNPNGSLQAIPSGGSGTYKYQWNNAASSTTAGISGLGAGTYQVAVLDSVTGCTDTVSATLSDSLALTTSIINVSNSLCAGVCNGMATAHTSGGVTNYSFLWTDGETDSSAVTLCPGKDFVTVTDGAGCTVVDSVTITGPTTALTDTLIASADTLGCGANANITLTATTNNGGTPPYTYHWSNGTTTAVNNIVVSVANTYCVTVSDINGCSSVGKCVIIAPAPALPTLSFSVTNVTPCFGGNNGAINLTVTPSGNYTYSWSPGAATTQNISGLTANTYNVTVTMSNGCTIPGDTSVTQPAQIAASVNVVKPISCPGSCDASVSAVVTSGRVPAFHYSWGTTATTDTISGLCAVTENVTVTDANGCTASASLAITNPTAITVNFNTITPISCNGTCNGSVQATPSGGSGSGYTYLWSNGNTTQTATALCAGEAVVTVTDGNGCSVVDSMNLIAPPVLSIGTFTTVNAACGSTDGSITANPIGGTPGSGYGFSWDNSATTQTISGLAANTYCVTITDANSCSVSGCDTVLGGGTGISISYTIPDTITCNGGSNAKILLSPPNGGVPPYTYSWSYPNSTDSATGLDAGTYMVTVTDHGGCSNSVTIVIGQPTALVFGVFNTVPISCSGKTDACVAARGSGGSGHYTFAWSASSSDTDSSLCNIGAGSYSVTITDAAGCSTSSSITLQDPETMSVFITGQGSCGGSCNGSIPQASISGGTPPYTYSWTNSCSGSVPPVPTPTGLCPNCTYTLAVTDHSGCSTASNPITISTLPAVTATATPTDTTICSNVPVTLKGSATVGATIIWTDVPPTSSEIETPDNANTVVINFAVGTNEFILTATDSSTGCSGTDTVKVTRDSVTANAGGGITLTCSTTSAPLNATGSGIWSVLNGQGSLSSNSNPNATISNVPPKDSVALVWTVTEGECSAADTIEVVNTCNDTTLIIPTGFTPNGDGFNDVFFIKGLQPDYSSNELQIFNRWGNEVFDQTNYDNTWAGQDNKGNKLSDGTYFWIFTSAHNNTKKAGYVDLRTK